MAWRQTQMLPKCFLKISTLQNPHALCGKYFVCISFDIKNFHFYCYLLGDCIFSATSKLRLRKRMWRQWSYCLAILASAAWNQQHGKVKFLSVYLHQVSERVLCFLIFTCFRLLLLYVAFF
jgi:hypothetical protein